MIKKIAVTAISCVLFFLGNLFYAFIVNYSGDMFLPLIPLYVLLGTALAFFVAKCIKLSGSSFSKILIAHALTAYLGCLAVSNLVHYRFLELKHYYYLVYVMLFVSIVTLTSFIFAFSVRYIYLISREHKNRAVAQEENSSENSEIESEKFSPGAKLRLKCALAFEILVVIFVLLTLTASSWAAMLLVLFFYFLLIAAMIVGLYTSSVRTVKPMHIINACLFIAMAILLWVLIRGVSSLSDFNLFTYLVGEAYPLLVTAVVCVANFFIIRKLNRSV